MESDEYLNPNFVSEPFRGLESYRVDIACRDKIVARRWKYFRGGESWTEFARSIRMEIINKNIIGIRREFQDVDGRDQSFYAFSALVEVAYWQIADMIMENQKIVRCEECKAPFAQTNDRQRFCPRRFYPEESACGRRARVRNYRKRKKNG